MLAGNKLGAGESGYTHGYFTGGSPYSNVVQKFEYETDGDGTDIGDLSLAMMEHCGNAQH